jgi:mannose/cellobiose epimerase-like protein (N-acyl-D-glucosamine 2-epimerase family)
MKAAVRRYERGDKDAGKILAGLLHALNLRFLGRPFQAGWIDRVDIDGNPVSETVPASTLYHLYTAFKEISKARFDPDDASRLSAT